jgi:hypothetical protein
MRHLLTVVIISALACNKTAKIQSEEPKPDPTANNLSCQTVWSSQSVSNIHWSVVVTVPDTSAVTSLTLRLASTLEPAFVIDKPKSQTYSQIRQTNRACPSGAADVYYFFEWKMTDGKIKKDDPFVVRG